MYSTSQLNLNSMNPHLTWYCFYLLICAKEKLPELAHVRKLVHAGSTFPTPLSIPLLLCGGISHHKSMRFLSRYSLIDPSPPPPVASPQCEAQESRHRFDPSIYTCPGKLKKRSTVLVSKLRMHGCGAMGMVGNSEGQMGEWQWLVSSLNSSCMGLWSYWTPCTHWLKQQDFFSFWKLRSMESKSQLI